MKERNSIIMSKAIICQKLKKTEAAVFIHLSIKYTEGPNSPKKISQKLNTQQNIQDRKILHSKPKMCVYQSYVNINSLQVAKVASFGSI